MRYNRMCPVLVIVFSVLLAGCAITSKFGTKTKCPGKSVTTISAYLYRDALKSFRKLYETTRASTEFKVIDTRILKTQSAIFDGRGRLRSGRVIEEWVVDHDGKKKTYEVHVIADGKKGNYFAIREIIEKRAK